MHSIRAIYHTEQGRHSYWPDPAPVKRYGDHAAESVILSERVSRTTAGDILVITFTKAAAQEMQSRFQALSRQRGVTFGTFHAVFFHILKYAYHYSAANILTEEKQIPDFAAPALRVRTSF